MDTFQRTYTGLDMDLPVLDINLLKGMYDICREYRDVIRKIIAAQEKCNRPSNEIAANDQALANVNNTIELFEKFLEENKDE